MFRSTIVHSFIALLTGCLLSSTALAVTPSAGCSLMVPPATPGQTLVVNISPGGGVRDGSYALYLPSTYITEHPTAVVMGLHGWTGNGPGALSGSGTAFTAERFEFITVWPSGVNWPDAGQGWAFPRL